MDRILIAVDNNTYAGHLEMTLRKVGYDIENTSTEYNLSEKLLSFNPDIIIAKGNSTRLSALNVGRKLKETIKFAGKVVLVISTNQKLSPQDLASIRADLMLFEPIGAMGLTMQVLNMDPLRKKTMLEKLIRMAEIDANFRQAEQNYLVQFGRDLDKELKVIAGQDYVAPSEDLLIKDSDISELTAPLHLKGSRPDPTPISHVTSDYLKALSAELAQIEAELPLRIDSYNHLINNVDGDLHKGHSKRDTQTVQKTIHQDATKDPGLEALKSIDKERQEYVNALWKKS
jgi:CheY-like chemotaxis protein